MKLVITSSASEADHRGFSRVRDLKVMPLGSSDAAVTECVMHDLAAPRTGELKAILATFLETTIGAVGAAAGVVHLVSPDGHALQIMCSTGVSAELQKEAESFVDQNCERSNIEGKLDRVACAAYVGTCATRQNGNHERSSFQSLITASLETPGYPGTSVGVLNLFFDAPREVSSGAMHTVAAFAEMMGAVIEHTRINREGHRTELLAERRVIANDIHDSLAQTLTFARMRISLLLEAIRTGNELMANKYTRDIDEALEISQKSARELITDFRSELNPGGLLASLEDLVAQFRERNNIVLEYKNRLVDLALPIEHEIQVFNIMREALTNIGRHSGATHARLLVDADFGYYIFTVEDNGVGAHTFAPVEGHFGVMIMRERAQRIGGEIKVESAIGSGTQVQLSFPEPSSDWRTASE